MNWELLLPDLGRMFDLLAAHPGHFLRNWWATFSVSATASIAALTLSLIGAILAVRFRLIEIIMAPTVALSQSFPLQAIAPLIIVVMGIGFHTKTTIAFVIAFFPIYGACVTAIKTTPYPVLAHLRVCRATFAKQMWYGRIPQALPTIISATKVGFTLAVLGAVVGEFIQPDRGLGYLLLIAQSSYDVEVIYLCVLLLIVQGVLIYGSLTVIESRLITRRAE